MQIKLAGRVILDEEPAGRKFTIPSKKDWQMPFIAVWLAGWAIFPIPSMMRAVHSLRTPGAIDWFSLLWGIGWMFGIGFALSTLLWGLGGNECLRVTASEVEFSQSLFGVVFRRRVSPTNEIRNLRYTLASSGHRRYRPGRIAFEDSRGTVSVGSPLSEAEGLAIIDQMLVVHAFPKKDKALEYMDLSL